MTSLLQGDFQGEYEQESYEAISALTPNWIASGALPTPR